MDPSPPTKRPQPHWEVLPRPPDPESLVQRTREDRTCPANFNQKSKEKEPAEKQPPATDPNKNPATSVVPAPLYFSVGPLFDRTVEIALRYKRDYENLAGLYRRGFVTDDDIPRCTQCRCRPCIWEVFSDDTSEFMEYVMFEDDPLYSLPDKERFKHALAFFMVLSKSVAEESSKGGIIHSWTRHKPTCVYGGILDRMFFREGKPDVYLKNCKKTK